MPTPNVSVVDLTFEAARHTTIEEINELTTVMKQTAAEHGRDGNAIPVYAMAMGKPGVIAASAISGAIVFGSFDHMLRLVGLRW
mgnify:CR=1 FL=1